MGFGGNFMFVAHRDCSCLENNLLVRHVPTLPSWLVPVPVILGLLGSFSIGSSVSVDKTLGGLWHASGNISDCIIIESSIGSRVSSSDAIHLVVVVIRLSNSASNTLSGGMLSQCSRTVEVS